MARPIMLLLAAGLLAGATASPAATRPAAPMPPARPADLGGAPAKPAPEPAAPPPPAAPAAAAPSPAAPPPAAAPSPGAPAPAAPSCLAELGRQGVRAEAASVPPGSGCTIEDPIRLLGFAARDGEILLPEKPLVACRLGAPLTTWLRDIAAPVLAAQTGSRLASVQTGPGFQCRPRNHIAGAKPSAHGVGLAIDIAGFTLADGRKLTVSPQAGKPDQAKPNDAKPNDAKPDESWRQTFAALRVAACGWFLTVLGPGSDPYHADHLHLDIQQHGSSDRYRICQ